MKLILLEIFCYVAYMVSCICLVRGFHQSIDIYVAWMSGFGLGHINQKRTSKNVR